MEMVMTGYMIYAFLLFLSVQWIIKNIRDETRDARTAHEQDHYRTNEYLKEVRQFYQTNFWGLQKELRDTKRFVLHWIRPTLYWKESERMGFLKAIVTLPKPSADDAKEFVVRVTADGNIKAVTKNGQVSSEITLPATSEVFEFLVKEGTPLVSVGVACRDHAGNTGEFTWSEPRDAVDNTAPPAPGEFSAAFESVAEGTDLPSIGDETIPDTIPMPDQDQEGTGEDTEPSNPK
jgi:hypothetical protein